MTNIADLIKVYNNECFQGFHLMMRSVCNLLNYNDHSAEYSYEKYFVYRNGVKIGYISYRCLGYIKGVDFKKWYKLTGFISED